MEIIYVVCFDQSVRFDFVKNAIVHNIHSINSKNIHFNVFACNNVAFRRVTLSAPGNSPNTDGIHIGDSNNVRITRSVIGTGDDCISMVSGSQNIGIENVVCGPGHGISIGSLGRSQNESVSNIHIKNCSFLDTQNGVRIKTWAPSYPSKVSNIVFEDIVMTNANNPIFIDQHYCPEPPCTSQVCMCVSVHYILYVLIKHHFTYYALTVFHSRVRYK